MPHDGDSWMAFAREDLRMAVLAMQEAIYNQGCFHSQQAVEKTLKSMIARQGVIPPRTHKTADLLPLVDCVDLSKIRHSLLRIDRFYIPTRYPDALPGMLSDGMPDAKDAEEAIQTVRDLLAIVDYPTGTNHG